MKTTIHWRSFFWKIIGLVIIVFSIIKMTVNPGFFGFFLGLGVIFLLAGKIIRIEINKTEIHFVRYYLLGIIKKKEVIKLNDIIQIDYEDGRTSWEDIFMGLVPSKDPGTLKIHRKNVETKEYELHFYKSEIRMIIETLRKKEKTFANSRSKHNGNETRKM